MVKTKSIEIFLEKAVRDKRNNVSAIRPIAALNHSMYFFDERSGEYINSDIYCKEVFIYRKKFGIDKHFAQVNQSEMKYFSAVFIFPGDSGEAIKQTLQQFCPVPVETLVVSERRSKYTIVFIKNTHFFNSQPYLLDFCILVCRTVSKRKSFLNKKQLLNSLGRRALILSLIINKFDYFLKIMSREAYRKFYWDYNGLLSFSSALRLTPILKDVLYEK